MREDCHVGTKGTVFINLKAARHRYKILDAEMFKEYYGLVSRHEYGHHLITIQPNIDYEEFRKTDIKARKSRDTFESWAEFYKWYMELPSESLANVLGKVDIERLTQLSVHLQQLEINRVKQRFVALMLETGVKGEPEMIAKELCGKRQIPFNSEGLMYSIVYTTLKEQLKTKT
jgi:hypothetical protein